MAFDVSYIRQFLEGIRDERGLYQNTAYRVGTGILMLLDLVADGDDRYLRRDVEDTAQEQITFLKGVVAQLQSVFANVDFSGVLRSLNGSEGSDGTGIVLNAPEGKITTDGLDVRGWMRIAKLIYNMIEIMEQDYTFSGGGDIESVVDNGNGTYTLAIHKEAEGRHTSFADYDILYGKVDELLEDGSYYSSYMQVCENGVTFNDGMLPDTVRVQLFANADVPGGANHAPKAMMTVARRGNVSDSTRQDYWDLSTTEKKLTFYWHVDQPILREDNISLCLGILPQLLQNVIPTTHDWTKPSLYVSSIFYEDAIRIRYPARVVKEERGDWTDNPTTVYPSEFYTGTWTPDGTTTDGGTQYAQHRQYEKLSAAGEPQTTITVASGQTIYEPYHYKTFTRAQWLNRRLNQAFSGTDARIEKRILTEWKDDLEVSRVWHKGCLWECRVDGTTQEPGTGNDWSLLRANNITLQFFNSLVNPIPYGNPSIRPAATINETIVPFLLLGQEDMSSIVTCWSWQRVSAYPDLDAVWNAAHTGLAMRTLNLRNADFPTGWNTDGGRLTFICTAEFTFGGEQTSIDNQINIG